MPMSPTVLVTSANGRTGRAVVDALLAAGARVRGLIRKEEQSARLKAIGAEPVLGDLEEAASLAAACLGCDTVVHIGPPMHAKEVDITVAMLKATTDAGVGHFVYYSVMQPLRQDVYHHRQKLIAEAHVVGAALPYTILQPTRYMQHLDAIWPQVRDEGVHAMPFNTQVRFNVVDLLDLADVVATVVTQPGHHYATYELSGPEALSQDDMASILREELGKPVVARAISPEALRKGAEAKGIPEARIERMLIMNHHYDAHGFLGNANILRWVLGREPATYRDHVRSLIKQA
jgi:uncharacterized protein YbjT (DUF2867 family)